ncbi:restriction endonuclease [Wenyingzhuangia fucanilytica]|uniref:Restriction endonuclease n=1 Tax=Wenyingzhuangia fucanilytica TaxID=1790137 RepID=A0A1B1Y5I8_9FLAO|nr:restriction endonuclease [Wenyingzhuangia fucanilytica]ANW96014.1 restriction endonuclease [Wenyingzhuangia fucanilytica]
MKQITLFEHDRLTLTHQYMNQEKLDALLRFNEFHDNKYFEGIAKGIKIKQFVGIIQVEDLTIEILPKVDKNKEENLWREVLLQMLKTTGRLKVETIGAANVNRQNLNLLEIYFEIYLKELQFLIHSGLVKQYRKNTSNSTVLKGKLEFAGNLRHNLVHKERFYTTHQVYDTNHQLHQVLNEALYVVDQFTKGTRLSDACKRIKMNFPTVSRIQINEKVLNKVSLNRKTIAYTKALELARLILLNYSPDIKSGKEKMLALLFDMNILWEEYVLTMLKKTCRGSEIIVKGQASKKFWGTYRTIRPDIVLQKGAETIIIDTKWKKPKNSQPSIEDLRQMYTYARFWNTSKVMLLYPGEGTSSPFKSYHNNQIDGVEHQCKISFASVLDNQNKLDKMLGVKLLYNLLK